MIREYIETALRHAHYEIIVTIPNPHRSAVGVELLQRILRQAEISREEWLGK